MAGFHNVFYTGRCIVIQISTSCLAGFKELYFCTAQDNVFVVVKAEGKLLESRQQSESEKLPEYFGILFGTVISKNQ